MRKVFLPQGLSECLSILAADPEARVYAGGTDLMVEMRAGLLNPASLICLERITEIKGVREEGDGLWIGAGTTHTELLHDPLIRRHLPIMIEALQTLGSPLIRNMGTIGGNICTASPAGDTLPSLHLLHAEVELQSLHTVRRLAIESFIAGPGKTMLKTGELLTGIFVKTPTGYNVHHFEKVGQRKALACCIASLAALLKISPSGDIEDARLAWGSVGPTIVRSPDVEAALIGARLCRDTLENAAALARRAVSPIDDIRASAAYRRKVAGNLLFRLLAGHVTSP